MKRILYFILLLSLIFAFVSCVSFDTDEPDGADGNGTENGTEDGGESEDGESESPDPAPTVPENMIYGKAAFPFVVCKDGEIDTVTSAINGVVSAIDENASMKPTLIKDGGAKFKHEIVFGDTSREISDLAGDTLRESLRDFSDELLSKGEDGEALGYIVYSDGSSVALSWSDYSIADEAIRYFTSEYLQGKELILEAGFTDTVTVSLTAYLDARDAKIKSEAWAALEAQLPEEAREGIISELKALYSLYTPDVIVWAANLYDPETGGFYCSNSARDNIPYLPDIESTWYGFGILESTGAAEAYGNKWANAIPEWAKERAADWIYSLQDEDGYFYHPQWPKEYIQANGLYSRISRDYNTGRTVLRLLGREPKYASAFSSNPLTDRLSGSSVAAVSKAVFTASVPYLESDAAFAEYLVSLEKQVEKTTDASRAYKFYSFGNTFQSVTGQLTDNMKNQLETFFDKHQNPENGLWSNDYHFDSTNGIHKIAAVYNSIGKELKYVDKVIESTIKILSFDPKTKPVRYGVDTYNAWSVFPYVYTNVRKYSGGTTEEREARCLEIKEKVFENAVTMIRIAKENIVNFKYPDGSFGYSRNTVGSGGTDQGCPSAVAGALEGNLNGTGIAMTSLTNCIFGALELSECKIPMFSERERVVYVKILEELDREYQATKK